MGNILGVVLGAAVLGLLVGFGAARLGFAGLKSFVSIYLGALAALMTTYLVGTTLPLALLATLAAALFTFIPAAAGFLTGMRLAKTPHRGVGNDANDGP